MNYYIRAKKGAKNYSCILKWEEDGVKQSKELSTGVPVIGNNKRKALNKAKEIRDEYEKKLSTQRLCPFQDLTFDRYILEWLDNQRMYLKPSTYYGYYLVITKHIVPYFKPLKIHLSDLAPYHLQSYYKHIIDKGLSATTVKRHHANIRKSLQDALIQNIIPYNVADRTRLPTQKKYQPTIYNDEQLSVLMRICKDTPIESVITLCLYYALRRGEACGLLWSDIDFDNKVIHIRNSRTTAKTELFQSNTKTASSTRDVPMSDEVLSYLNSIKLKKARNKLFFGKAYHDNDYVCTWDDGKPLAVNYVSKAFSALLKRNGLPHIRLHDVRHSVATSMLNNNIDLKIIQEYLGHSTIATTANCYLHPDLKQKSRALDAISAQLKSAI